MARRTFWKPLSTAAAILILAAGCSDQLPTETTLQPETAALSRSSAPGQDANVVQYAQKGQAGTASALITPAGGTLEFANGSITFPEGALDHATVISATVDGESASVTFAPHGLQFPSDARPTLSLSYAGADVDPAGVGIKYVEGSQVKEHLTTVVDLGNEIAIAAVRHFSQYVIATN